MPSVQSLVLGMLVAVMVLMNGALANQIGLYTANVIIHASGLVFIVGVMLVNRARVPLRPAIPAWLLSGGALGFLTVVCANVGYIDLGVSLTLALGLLGQTVAAIVIDHFGWLGAPVTRFDPRKIISLVLIASGIAAIALA